MHLDQFDMCVNLTNENFRENHAQQMRIFKHVRSRRNGHISQRAYKILEMIYFAYLTGVCVQTVYRLKYGRKEKYCERKHFYVEFLARANSSTLHSMP